MGRAQIGAEFTALRKLFEAKDCAMRPTLVAEYRRS